MTTAVWVRSHVLGSPENTLVTRRELLHYGTQYAVDSAIRSLKRKGDIIPVCSGVYLRVGRILSVAHCGRDSCRAHRSVQ